MTRLKTRRPQHQILILAIAVVCLAGFVAQAAATEFPYRKDYPGIPTIDTEALYAGYNTGEILIVDVRSKIEYQVIHPDGAVHVPVGNKGFVNNIKALMAKNPGKNSPFIVTGSPVSNPTKRLKRRMTPA